MPSLLALPLCRRCYHCPTAACLGLRPWRPACWPLKCLLAVHVQLPYQSECSWCLVQWAQGHCPSRITFICWAADHAAQRRRDGQPHAVRPPPQRLPQPAVHERQLLLQLGLLGGSLRHDPSHRRYECTALHSPHRKGPALRSARCPWQFRNNRAIASSNRLRSRLMHIPRLACPKQRSHQQHWGAPRPLRRARRRHGRPRPAAAAPADRTWPSGAAGTPARWRPATCSWCEGTSSDSRHWQRWQL
jgi:hypothetical protein